MANGDFFRMNLPYGLIRNSNNEWMLFNRDYMPIGYVDYSKRESMSAGNPGYQELPIYTKYKGLTEKLLKQLAHRPDSIR